MMYNIKLRTHFILYFLVVTLLLTASIVFIYTSRFKDLATSNLAQYGKTITLNASFSVADFLIAENYAPMQEFIADLSDRTEVIDIAITDTVGVVLAHSDVNQLGTMLPKEIAAYCLEKNEEICVHRDRRNHQLIVTSPVVIEDMKIGKTRVFLSLEPIMQQVSDIRMKGILTALVVWLISIVLGIFGARQMTKPLARLVDVTKEISQGNFIYRKPKSKWVSEINTLSQALEKMGSDIETREFALKKSEKKFRSLFERAMEGVFVSLPNGQVKDVNPTMLEILGYEDRDLLIGKNLFSDLLVGLQPAQRLHDILITKKFVRNYELVMRHLNGDELYCSLTCHAVYEEETGSIKLLEGLIRDITQQKKAAEEITRMRNYLSNIIESMPSMLVTTDHDGYITQWNTAAYKITGVAASKAIGRTIWDIAPFFDKYRQYFSETNQYRNPVELHREQPDENDDSIYNMTFFPLIANGTNGIAIRLDDITELEEKEQQLIQAQKMDTVGTLAGGLAHDFNNMLGGILGTISLLEYKINIGKEVNDTELYDYLKRMENSGQRAADLVQQLLTLSRQQEVDLVPVDLNLSIKHVKKIANNTFDKSINFIIDYALQSAYVMADPTQIEQVLLNLCINGVHAMTFMRPNDDIWGGTLSIELKQVDVDDIFRTSHPEAAESRYWLISVSDNGVGMSPKILGKIFDPFFTTKEKGKGTGLGLAMVYNIIQQQNGFLDVYSEPGQGTTFNVYLPFLERGLDGTEAVREKHIYHGKGLVLVVDDDEIMLRTACEILEMAGYDVITAINGLDGVDRYREKSSKISLVIMDMVMPIKAGREAFMEMKEINSQVNVLLVSGFRYDARVEEVMRLGVRGFLQKPFTMEGLTSAVHGLLQGDDKKPNTPAD